jgi:hypothetical protein
MRRLLSSIIVMTVLFVFTSITAYADPFPVCPDQNEADWQSWGYTVDQQNWGNWFVVNIPWDTASNMSGVYTIKEDFLFQVDPSTCDDSTGLDCNAIYGANWFQHKNADCSQNVNGLGEFFDAGILNTNVDDGQYSLDLDLTANTWAVFYDANRNQVNDGGSEHNILEGTVLCYFDVNGFLYAVLQDDDEKYNGFFTSGQNEGTPDLLNGTFHLGSAQYPSEQIASAFASGDKGFFAVTLISLKKQGVLSKKTVKAIMKCAKIGHSRRP